MRTIAPLLAGMVVAAATAGAAQERAGVEAPDLPPAQESVLGIRIPLVVDEDGDTMTGNLAFAGGAGVQFPGGSLTGNPGLRFGPNAVCLADVVVPGCAAGGDVSAVLTPAGSGLAGGAASGDVSLAIVPGGVTGAMLQDGGVGLADLGFDPATQSELDGLAAWLFEPGTLNAPSNPVDWTKLKGVPAGIADGVDAIDGGNAESLDGLNSTQFVRTDASSTVQAELFVHGARSVDGNAPLPYPVSLRRYHLEATKSKVGATVPLNATVFNSLCKDEDGCSVTLGMRNWDPSKAGLTASRGPYRFYYSMVGASNWWRTSDVDTEGRDGDNVVTHALQAWDCYFTDSEVSNFSGTDAALGFGLMNWNSVYTFSGMRCILTIDD